MEPSYTPAARASRTKKRSTSTLPEIYADTDGRVVDQKRRRVHSHALLHDGVNHFADGVFAGKFLGNFEEGSYAPVLGVVYNLNDGARRAGARASISLSGMKVLTPSLTRREPWTGETAASPAHSR